jgi:hypothetical protein
MRSIKAIQEELAPQPEVIPKISKWRAYKDGNFQIFNSSEEAHGFSKLVERYVDNQDEYDFSKKNFDGWWSRVYAKWDAELRHEFDYLSDKIYAICYNEAYDRGHSAGYDEVASYMINASNFVEEIVHALIADKDNGC